MGNRTDQKLLAELIHPDGLRVRTVMDWMGGEVSVDNYTKAEFVDRIARLYDHHPHKVGLIYLPIHPWTKTAYDTWGMPEENPYLKKWMQSPFYFKLACCGDRLYLREFGWADGENE